MIHGYIEKLIEPNTLSNIALAIVGIVGIGFAWKTVKATQNAAEATRVAAEATREQAQIARTALISQFRPQIQVRAVRLIETDEEFVIRVLIVNKGGTIGELTGGNIDAFFYFPYSPLDHPITSTPVHALSLTPGEENALKLNLKNDRLTFSMLRSSSSRPDQRTPIICRGKFQYRDGNGIIRTTSFERMYDLDKEAFIIRPNTEDEYAD